MKIDNSWWLDELKFFGTYNPSNDELITVAEITKPYDHDSAVEIYTALVNKDDIKPLLEEPFSCSWPLQTSGPHPTCIPSGRPWFRLESAGKVFETLVVSWESAGKTILLPDQGFLMTYGLIPRVIKSDDNDVVYWDDLTIPHYGVVKAKSTSKYQYTYITNAKIQINKLFLQDYATSRDKVIAQFYWIYSKVKKTETINSILKDNPHGEIKQNGRTFLFITDMDNDIQCEIRGVRPLFYPGVSPIIGDFFNVQDLKWPGIDETITSKNWNQFPGQFVYVNDSVLAKYEERPDIFTIDPETGGVSLSSIWSVGYCRRIGRDIIGVELKKLYEGNLSNVIKHWYNFSVESPNVTDETIRNASNIAKRAKKIIEEIFEFGSLISKIDKQLFNEHSPYKDFIGYDVDKLKYEGLWSNPYLLRVANHCRKSIGKDTFQIRCSYLQTAFIENFKEKYFRKLLLKLGIKSEEIAKLGSLKLINLFIFYCQLSSETGLQLIKNFIELDKRRKEKFPALTEEPNIITPLKTLFMLNVFRIDAVHRGQNLQKLIDNYDIDQASLHAGWGELLDNIYDGIGEMFEKINSILKDTNI